MSYTSIKLKFKNVNWHNYLFYAVVTINTLIYLFFDFKNGDVEPNVRIYGIIQLIVLLLVIFTIETDARIKNKIFQYVIKSLLTFSFIVLMLIQIVPAALWIGWSGQIVAEPPYDNGVTAHWIYGVYHIFIIIWGVYIAVKHSKAYGNSI